MIKNLVLSGGGTKIFCFLGVLKAFEEYGILDKIDTFIGSSAGSIMAAFYCLGYNVEEIIEISLGLKLENLRNIHTNNIMNFMENYGLDDAEKFYRMFKIVIKAKLNKEDITFKELYDKTNKNLIITTTCLNTMDEEFFCHRSTPDFKVLDAVVMSISIPFLFKPYKFNNKYYIDGSITNHYPINYFDLINDNKYDSRGIKNNAFTKDTTDSKDDIDTIDSKDDINNLNENKDDPIDTLNENKDALNKDVINQINDVINENNENNNNPKNKDNVNETDRTLGVLLMDDFSKELEINNIEEYLYYTMLCSFTKNTKNIYRKYKDKTILIECDSDSFMNFDMSHETKTKFMDHGYEKTILYLDNNKDIFS